MIYPGMELDLCLRDEVLYYFSVNYVTPCVSEGYASGASEWYIYHNKNIRKIPFATEFTFCFVLL